MSKTFDCRELSDCAFNNHVDHVQWWLDNGYDADIRDEYTAMTPLMNAASNNALKTMKLLIAYGANVNAVDFGKNGFDPDDIIIGSSLFFATNCGYHKAVQLLVGNGAIDDEALSRSIDEYVIAFNYPMQHKNRTKDMNNQVKIMKILIGHGFCTDLPHFEKFLKTRILEPDMITSVTIGMIEKLPRRHTVGTLFVFDKWPSMFIQCRRFDTKELYFHRIEGLSAYWNRNRVGILTALLLGRRWSPACPFHESVLQLEIFVMIAEYARLFFFPGEISKKIIKFI